MQTEKTEDPDTVFRDYIYKLRRLQLSEVYVLFDEDFTPELQKIVADLVRVKFEEGSMFQYYGELRRAVAAFMLYWSEAMAASALRADHAYNRDVPRDYLIKAIEDSGNVERRKQSIFNSQFLPVRDKDERDKYKEIIAKHHEYIASLKDIKTEVENYVRHSYDIEFLQKCALMSPTKSNEMFIFTHTFIALYLSTVLQKVKISIEEIYRRLKNNLSTLQTESKEQQSILKTRLFDKEAEKYNAMKNEDLLAVAELRDEISSLLKQLEPSDTMENSIAELETEIQYWSTKLEELKVLTESFNVIKQNLDSAVREEYIYSKLETTELPGIKRDIFATIGENVKERHLWLQPKFEDTCKAIITFFTIKGYDNKFYTDRFHTYYIDRFGHKVGIKQAEEHHFDCDGNYLEIEKERKYYRDDKGRYVVGADGGRLYQRGACCSFYKLGDNSLLTKTDSPGPSGETQKQPTTKATEDTRARGLSREAAEYLWSTFAGLLPRALGDVLAARPNDPIHYLAHRLLKLKLNRTHDSVKKMAEEDKQYALDIYKKREEKLAAARAAWRGGRARRAGGADLDEAEGRAALVAFVAAEQFALALACRE